MSCDGVGVPASPKRRVLIIDDDPLWRRALDRLLRANYRVSHAVNGLDALEKLANGGLFEAILCDIEMPSLDGISLHARMRELLPEQARRVAFVTGQATKRTLKYADSVRRPIIDKSSGIEGVLDLVHALIVEAENDQQRPASEAGTTLPQPPAAVPTASGSLRVVVGELRTHARAAVAAFDALDQHLERTCDEVLDPQIGELRLRACELRHMTLQLSRDITDLAHDRKDGARGTSFDVKARKKPTRPSS